MPDLQLMQSVPDHTTEYVWGEVIPSPPSSSDETGLSDKLDESFLEKFIDLGAVGPGSVGGTASTVLDDLLVSPKQDSKGEEVPVENCYGSALVTLSPSGESLVDVETINETDLVALVPEVTEEMCLVPSGNNWVDSPMLDFKENNVILSDHSILPEITELDPSVLSMLESSDASSIPDESKVSPNLRKRESTDVVERDRPPIKRSKLLESSSLDKLALTSDQSSDKVAERRRKNNEASRICRATRKARHQELFDRENELIRENNELTSKIEDLSSTVNFLRNYLVEKLSRK